MSGKAGDPMMLPADLSGQGSKYFKVKADESGVELQTVAGGGIESSPPSGKYRVTNLFVDPATGRLTVQYDDTPQP